MPKLTTLAQMRSVAEKVSSFIGNIVQTVVDALEEMENTKADKPKSASITIPTAGWKSDSTSGYPYYYDISLSSITTNDCVSVVIAPSSQQEAVNCGLCPTCETLAGIIRIRSANSPSSAISAQYWVEQGKGN